MGDAVISRLKSLNVQQRRLILSLVANFATRIPGLAGVLFFLPRLKAEIGLDDFAIVMASIALGGSATFVMAGVTFIARRLIGEAYSRGDEAAQADAARGVFDVAVVAVLLCSVGIVGYGLLRQSPAIFHFGALVTAFAVLIQQQDGIRAAYNEHYVTAIIQVVLQTLVYVAVLLILPRSIYSMTLGILVIMGVPLLSSLLSLIDLVRKRPFLMRGRPHQRGMIARQGVVLGLGEGLLMASLSFVVLYLDFRGAVAESAWFATTLRLFMVVLVPVVLILMPLSSYIRLIWNSCPPRRQRQIILGTLLVSMVYSMVVGAAMIVAARLYIGGAMHIADPGTWAQTLTIFAMFSAVVVFKSYTSVAFVVLDSKWLSMAAVSGTVVAIAVAMLGAPWLSPIGAVTLFSAALTLAIVAMTTVDALRFRQPAPDEPETTTEI